MDNLPTKPTPVEPTEVEVIPTWRELGERIRDVIESVAREGKELERDLEPKFLPALKRVRAELEKLIARVEQRIAERPPKPEPPPKQPAEPPQA
jgi:hypothetical protein